MVPLLILFELIDLFIFRQILIFLYGCGILAMETCIMQIRICWTSGTMFSSRSLAPHPFPARTGISHTYKDVYPSLISLCLCEVIDTMGSSVLDQAESTVGEEGMWGRLQSARLCWAWLRPGLFALSFSRIHHSFINFLKGKESLFNELLWRKLSKGEKKRNTVSSLLPRLMTCITPTIVLFRQPSSLADIKFVCSHMVDLLLFFLSMQLGFSEETWWVRRRRGGEDSHLQNAVDVPFWLYTGCTQASWRESAVAAMQMRSELVPPWLFYSFEHSENVGVHVKTALWGSSDMWGCLAQTQHIITQSIWQRYRANLYVTVPEQLL